MKDRRSKEKKPVTVGERLGRIIPGRKIPGSNVDPKVYSGRPFSDEELSKIPGQYRTVVKDVCQIGGDNGDCSVFVPSGIVGSYLNKRDFKEAIRSLGAKRVGFVVSPELASNAGKVLEEKIRENPPKDEPSRFAPVRTVKKPKFANTDGLSRLYHPNRTPFLRMKSNKRLHDLIEDVAKTFSSDEKREETYSPIIISCPDESGKTHALHNLAWKLHLSPGDKKLRMTSGRSIEREHTRHCKDRERYGDDKRERTELFYSLNGLLLDNADYLLEGNKRSTVSWLLGFVEDMVEHGKVIVATTRLDPFNIVKRLEYELGMFGSKEDKSGVVKGENGEVVGKKVGEGAGKFRDHKSNLKRLFDKLSSGRIVEAAPLDESERIPFFLEYIEEFFKLNGIEHNPVENIITYNRLKDVGFHKVLQGYGPVAGVARQICDDILRGHKSSSLGRIEDIFDRAYSPHQRIGFQGEFDFE